VLTAYLTCHCSVIVSVTGQSDFYQEVCCAHNYSPTPSRASGMQVAFTIIVECWSDGISVEIGQYDHETSISSSVGGNDSRGGQGR
jgi:hypothetical protein